MKIVRAIICLGLLLTPAPLAAGDRAGKSGETKLPIPRFVSLRAAEVNMRAGPGREYRITWIYKRRGLPMEVVREFGHWRQVREFSGDSGWIRSNMLSGIENVQVIAEIGTMHTEPETGSRAGGQDGARGHRQAARLRRRLVPDRGQGLRRMGKPGTGLGDELAGN